MGWSVETRGRLEYLKNKGRILRIFQLNKYVTLNGGSETVADIVARVGNACGHEVLTIGYEKPGQQPLFESDSLGPDRMTVPGMFRNPKLVARVKTWIREFRPDAILHHNIYHHFPMAQLVDSIDKEFQVRQSIILHDHKPVCPVYTGFRAGKPCHACSGGGLRYLNALRHRCKDGSLVKTALLSADSVWNSSVGGVYSRFHRVISPSRFLAGNVAGIGKGRSIEVLTNPCPPARLGSERRDGILYASRLSQEKGLDVVLDAARRNPGVRFLVAGDGPEQGKLDAAVREVPNVEPLGRLPRDRIVDLMGQVRYLMIPSLGMENNPMIILEAFARGTPVLGSNRGGIPELLEDGRGFLFDPEASESVNSVVSAVGALSEQAWTDHSARCIAWAERNNEKSYLDKLVALL